MPGVFLCQAYFYCTFQNCLHGICNAHTQRELTSLHEQLQQVWAAEMIELL
jgi:transposase